MNETNITPEKITKPIQLLAVWLVGLILLVSALLTAAGVLKTPNWLPVFLSIAAVSIIPIFLALIFLLQTRFRPEMQEDVYYEKYLNRNTNKFEYTDKNMKKASENNLKIEEIINLSNETKKELETIRDIIQKEKKTGSDDKIDEIILNSDEKLDSLKRLLMLSNLELKINKSLPHYQSILEVIKGIGFTRFEEFGGVPPDKNVISFGIKVSPDIVKELIKKLNGLGINYLKKSTTSPYSIIIGSYRVDDKKKVINDELIKRLENVKEFETLSDII